MHLELNNTKLDFKKWFKNIFIKQIHFLMKLHLFLETACVLKIMSFFKGEYWLSKTNIEVFFNVLITEKHINEF